MFFFFVAPETGEIASYHKGLTDCFKPFVHTACKQLPEKLFSVLKHLVVCTFAHRGCVALVVLHLRISG